MPTTWPYFVEAAAAGVGIAIAIGNTYFIDARQKNKSQKYAALLWTFMCILFGSMVLGFELTYFDRDDGRSIQWGRWALFTITHGTVVATITACFSNASLDFWISVLLGCAQSLFLLGGALTPSGNDGNPLNALWFFTVSSALFCILSAVHVAVVAFNWKRLFVYNVVQNGQRDSTNWWTKLIAVAGVFIGLVAYTLLFALGPEGFQVYSDDTLQIFLLIGLDGLVKFVVVGVYYLFVDMEIVESVPSIENGQSLDQGSAQEAEIFY